MDSRYVSYLLLLVYVITAIVSQDQFDSAVEMDDGSGQDILGPNSAYFNSQADKVHLHQGDAHTIENNESVSLVDGNAAAVPQNEADEPLIQQFSDAQISNILRKVEECETAIDMVFLIDSSASIKQVFDKQMNWTLRLIDDVPVDQESIRMAVIQYSKYPTTEFSLNTYANTRYIKKHLSKISLQPGSTRTGFALRKVESELQDQTKGSRPNAQKIVVLFTDGNSVDDPFKPADRLREQMKAKIYVVALGTDASNAQLKRIAGNEAQVFGAEDYASLQESLRFDVEQISACGTSDIVATNDQEIIRDHLLRENLQEIPTEPISTDKNDQLKGDDLYQWEAVDYPDLSDVGVDPSPIDDISVNNDEIRSSEPEESERSRMGSDNVASESVSLLSKILAWEVLIHVDEEKISTFELKTFQGVEKLLKVPDVLAQSNDEESLLLLSSEAKNSLSPTMDDARTTTERTSVSATPVNSRTRSTTVKTTDAVRSTTTKTNTARDSLTTTRRETVSTKSTVKPFAKNRKNQTTSSLRTQRTTVIGRTVHNRAHTTLSPSSTSGFVRKEDFFNSVADKSRAGDCALDLLFIIDSSGSVQSIYEHQKDYLMSTLGKMQVNEASQRIALIQFAGSRHQRTEWTFDTFDKKESVMNAFAHVRHFTGTTYIGRALDAATRLLKQRRINVPTIVVLVSDGFSQDSALRPAQEIRTLSQLDFYAFSMAELVNHDYLTTLIGDESKLFVGERHDEFKRVLEKRIHCEP